MYRRGEIRAKIFGKIMVENYPKLVKGINLHIQETQWSPNKISTRKSHLGTS